MTTSDRAQLAYRDPGLASREIEGMPFGCSVEEKGNLIYVTMGMPPDVAQWFCTAGPALWSAFCQTTSKRAQHQQVDAFQRQSQIEIIEGQRRRSARLGRIASRHVRKLKVRGVPHDDAIKLLANELAVEIEFLKTVIRNHDRIARKRHQRMRKHTCYRWALAGKKNKEIARRLGISVPHAQKLVQQAIQERQTEANRDALA